MAHNQGFLTLVNDAKKNIKEYSIEQVVEKFKRGDKFYFVDTREDEEWAASRVPGAIHLGKGVIERDIESTIPDKNAEIVLYCGGGFRSALAAEALQKMGYKNVSSMDGGIRGWAERGLPIEE
ncbi:MAG: sulfurtransferase [Oligoflexia bacterium]|nr:sulfurtransferase [Oligoflexia bacterium]